MCSISTVSCKTVRHTRWQAKKILCYNYSCFYLEDSQKVCIFAPTKITEKRMKDIKLLKSVIGGG